MHEAVHGSTSPLVLRIIQKEKREEKKKTQPGDKYKLQTATPVRAAKRSWNRVVAVEEETKRSITDGGETSWGWWDVGGASKNTLPEGEGLPWRSAKVNRIVEESRLAGLAWNLSSPELALTDTVKGWTKEPKRSCICRERPNSRAAGKDNEVWKPTVAPPQEKNSGK